MNSTGDYDFDAFRVCDYLLMWFGLALWVSFICLVGWGFFTQNAKSNQGLAGEEVTY